MSAPEAKTKKFGAGERKIPHHTEKAPKYYPAEDVAKPKTVRSKFLVAHRYGTCGCVVMAGIQNLVVDLLTQMKKFNHWQSCDGSWITMKWICR